MLQITLSQLLVAFGMTFAAGLATVIGSGLVFFSKTPSPRVLAFGLAFAGGAMVFVSLTELFNQSRAEFVQAASASLGLVYATFSFLFGLILVMLIDQFIPNPHDTLDAHDPKFQQQNNQYIARIGMMSAFAITAHNLPEGLATFFANLDSPTVGLPLALAIAIHNIPEGISIAAPMYFATRNKKATIIMCLLSGMAEPFGAILGYTILHPFLSHSVFGVVFGVIAGAMVYLALDELLPAAKRYAKGHETVYGLVTGMAVIALSLALFDWAA